MFDVMGRRVASLVGEDQKAGSHTLTIQTETAVRHIASSYPYDNRGSGALSLRDNAEEITGQLSAEVAARVRPRGSGRTAPRRPGSPRSRRLAPAG